MAYRPLRFHRAADPLWLCLAALLGLGCLQLPLVLAVPDETGRKLVGQAGFFFAGVLLGFIRPEGAWRWGLASVLLVPAVDLSLAMNTAIFPSLTALDCLPWLASQTPKYLARALPAIVGSCLGAYWGKT